MTDNTNADCETGQCAPAPVYHAPAEVQITQPMTRPHDPLDPTTFVAPRFSTSPGIVVEFCDRCRWLHRATWTQTELFLTFPPPALTSITLIPLNSTETGGRFRVWLLPTDAEEPKLVWDRKTEGGFPELKVLKQRIRDVIQPGTSLGHSDTKAST
ncbi:hypothetical protein RSOLAG22IIIB_02249 [Rhizoctonia solani]|uniref:Uncharacterized protein n=1 Tax=Rhizoctonia solani TaxID=456999 RepID=A0A0K6GE65_9AGAM|nr:hypothetical protein RSOLAG22IIIB_02249 [Rhizoctonia solani]